MVIFDYDNNKGEQFINDNYIKMNNHIKYPIKEKDDPFLDNTDYFLDLAIKNLESEKILNRNNNICPISVHDIFSECIVSN